MIINCIDGLKQVESTPPHPRGHSGPCVIVGSAWSARDDLYRALSLRPKAYLIGVNRSISHFPCNIMVAIDRAKAEDWKKAGEEKYGHIELHGGRFGAHGGPETYPHYDFWWPEFQEGGGTSAMLATKIALNIGFDEVILCGCPIGHGPYLDGEDDWSRRDEKQLEAYREPWRKHKYLHPFVRSMSGFTRDLLGEPDGV